MVLNEDDAEDLLLDSGFVNRKLVLKTLGDHVNSLCKIWTESIEKKPISWEWRIVSFFYFTQPSKSLCQQCIETMGVTLGDLTRTLKNPLQFKTYLDVFKNLTLNNHNTFDGTGAEESFGMLVMYVNHRLEEDLKRAKTASMELPDFKTSNLSQ